MKIHVLGIYGPFPAGNGATSGYLAEEAGTLVQFDLGSGILSRLTARTAPEKLSAVFLSHWHFDHASDISLLMACCCASSIPSVRCAWSCAIRSTTMWT